MKCHAKIGEECPACKDPQFPAAWITNESPPRRITLLGTAAIDPDVWVAKIEGEEDHAWVVKCGRGVCHKTTDVLKVRAHPDDPREYDDGGGPALAAYAIT